MTDCVIVQPSDLGVAIPSREVGERYLGVKVMKGTIAPLDEIDRKKFNVRLPDDKRI